MTYKNTRRGFTLIELLVVVLIIGILAAVAVPQYQKAVIKSGYTNLKNLTESIARAQEVYYLTNGKYSDDFAELDIEMPGNRIEKEYAEDDERADHKRKTYYYYDWGKCFLEANNVYCENFGIQMYYQVLYQHYHYDTGSTWAGHEGARICGRRKNDNTTIQAQICKAETGKKKPVFYY